jgi:hypothetical protein
MTFQEFLEKWNGKPCDFDGWYGTQCMDLMHQYIVDVLGITDGRVLAAAAAKDVYNNFDNIFGHEHFDKIPNTPTGMPQEGDIIFWSSGTYGHVAVVISATLNKITSFDANFEYTNCHVQEHTYGYCLGWLRYKGTMPSSLEAELDQCRKDRDGHYNDKMALYKEEGFEGPFNLTVAIEKIKMLMSIEQQVKLKDQQLLDAQAKITDLQKEAVKKEEELKTLQKDMQELNERVTSAVTDNQILQKKLEKAQADAQKPTFVGWRKKLYEFLLK